MNGFVISEEYKDMDVELIHKFVTNSYWAKGIPVATVKKSIENSMCFAVLTDDGNQVAFARMVTDKATFAYLADVFVVDSHKGKGIGTWLIEHIMTHRDLQGLRRMMLATMDAHGLYKKFGFKSLTQVDRMMEIKRPNIYLETATD